MYLEVDQDGSTKVDRWLITGGAGYIGAHIAQTFLENGKEVVLLDNMSNGSIKRIEHLRNKFGRDLPFEETDINDSSSVDEVFSRFNPSGVIHTAGLKSVSESFKIPEEYERHNLHATKTLLMTAEKFCVKKFLFSSTAAIYSDDNGDLINEESRKEPKSPYGVSKLMAENELERFNSLAGFQGIALRFFNVIGASSKELLDTSSENLIPILYKKILNNESPMIFGHDYETHDGTCIRDFIDVRDVAKAHLAVAELEIDLPFSLNLGSGKGYSVLEIFNLLKMYLGNPNISPTYMDRRMGDIGNVQADISKAKNLFGFETTYTVDESIKDFCKFSQIQE